MFRWMLSIYDPEGLWPEPDDAFKEEWIGRQIEQTYGEYGMTRHSTDEELDAVAEAVEDFQRRDFQRGLEITEKYWKAKGEPDPHPGSVYLPALDEAGYDAVEAELEEWL